MSQLKLSLQLKTKLQQTLRLTPQLQLAMKMLQLNHMELADLIKQEVEQNPMLEIPEASEAAAPEPADAPGPRTTPATPGAPEAPGGIELANELEARKIGEKDHFQDAWIQYQMDSQDSAYSSSESGVNYDSDDDSNMEEYVSSKPSLAEQLHVQLCLSSLTPHERKIGEYVIGLLDPRGYLFYDEEMVLSTLGISKDVLDRVVATLQTFDPPGIGARNLTECLLLQYQSRTHRNPLVERLITDHLEDLANNRLKLIAQKEKVSVEEVIEAYREIKTLDPKPAIHYDVQDKAQYITPDVFVEKVGDELKVTLNDKYIPSLRINKFYQSQLRAEKVANKDTISYIKDKLHAARFIMESIERRKDTIFRVTREIFDVQGEFFEHGVKGLHQLTLKKVADKLGLHESTISRVTNSKWVHTPRGVFQLKFFFSSGTITDQGEDISSKHVRDLIKAIVETENTKRPHSDAKIVSLLKDKGIEIARRTVTKYREELGIRSSSKRKQFA